VGRRRAAATSCSRRQEADGVHRTLASAWGFTLRTRLLTWAKVYPKCASCEHHWDSHEAPLVAEDLPGACGWCIDDQLASDAAPVDRPDPCQAFVPRVVRGPGNYSMQGCESLWVGTRGDFPWCDRRAVRNIPEALFEPRRKPHSRKPERAYARVEALWPTVEPRLELFARYRRPAWFAWGKQAPSCDLVFGDVIGSTWPVPVAAPVVHRDLKPENLLFSEASAAEEGRA
jgi:hypothetical protein